MRKANRNKRTWLTAGLVTAAVFLAACGQKEGGQEAAVTSPQTTASQSVSETEEASVKDGVYSRSAKGNNGDVTVEVEVKDGSVVRAEVVEHEETPGISDKAVADIPKAIVEYQSLGIDAVSGATNTSNAVLSAVELCLKEAGMDV